MPIIKDIVDGSIAEEGGILPGDTLISINGTAIKDIFDYHFLSQSSQLEILLMDQDDEEWILDVEKDEDEELGLVFDEEQFSHPKACCNKCVFCFIDQMPKGMRQSLYFKDDDLGLSFTNGNYVTLTNVKQEELDRIVRYRMSPVNISIHATDPALRGKMLGLRKKAAIMDPIRFLTENQIQVNGQIVLCKGYNDKEALDHTLSDLSFFNEKLTSVSVVPLGMTQFRENLAKLSPFNEADAVEILKQIEKWQQYFLAEKKSRVVFPADEFFLLANQELPNEKYYEDFPQLENGVGMLTIFRSEFKKALKNVLLSKTENHNSISNKKAWVLTGVAAYSTIKECTDELNRRFDFVDIQTIPVENLFFGGDVTVTGLLTGYDILECMKKRNLDKNTEIFISTTMLKHGTELLLDDISIEMLRNMLKVDIIAVENTGYDFIHKLLKL